ncbi:serine/threonine-protein phosphatase 6 regulatory ankyrin repeat subunit B-like isoform X2 [Mytilus californianus]|uniref:serine/threonine-protein phosphatase 6 regulatory ankyrin repeat subunit B-like isoform X2 n=1 Tax=Mytilus californianus TaxID=6549 RepID=UPI0022483B2A|nr:serine/threonine-protein phosphatase 6 regulatory ankyrin repeat subunit B-like isoform X2 [Mytilus californianus]
MEVFIVFLVVPLVTINAKFLGIVNRTRGGRCPRTFEERQARSELVNCSPVEKYHCLFDSEFELVEACSDYKQLPQGNYPRFNSYATGNPIDYDPCPDDRFQLWPVKSYEISECLSIKSTCSGEGQEICKPGTDRTDRKCKCDYKAGYAMNGGVCCSPSELQDCFCYKKICGLNMELDEGYNCIEKCSILNADGSCSTHSENVTLSFRHISTFKETEELEYIQDTGFYFYVIFIMMAIFSFSCFIGVWYILRRHRYTGRRRKYIYLFFLALVLLGNYVLSTLIYFEKIHVDYKITLMAMFVVPVLGCMFAISMIFYYKIQKDRNIYNEEYEVKIFELLNAAKDGNIDDLRRIAHETYVEMHDVDYDQRSALHLAACECQVEAVQYLLERHFCSPGATDRWNRTAREDAEWHQANDEKKKNYNEVISLLAKYKTKKTKAEHFREKCATEIIHAAKNGEIHTLRRLQQLGVDMDLSNSAGRTALHAAAVNGIEKVVDFLIEECKVSPFVRWMQKRPVDYVPDNGNKVNRRIREKLRDYMDRLLEAASMSELQNKTKEAPPDKQTQIVRLLNCASRGNIQRMKSFKEANYDMDLCDYDNRTALHIAVSDNQEHIVDFLLGECNLQNVARNMKDRWNNTPLSIAQEPGYEEVYKVFLKHCIILVDTENDEYRTYELLDAGANGKIEVLKRLHNKKVNMNLRDYDGRTALHLAAAENQLEAVKFLVNEAKVETSIPDRENRRPFNEAKHEEIKNLLGTSDTEHTNATYYKPSTSSQTIFLVMDAASKGQLHNLKDSFSYFPMDSCDYFKNTPLHVAASKAKLEDVNYLLNERKVSPFVRNSFWKTPIQLVEEKIQYWQKKEFVADQNNEKLLKNASINVLKNVKTSRRQDFEEVKNVLNIAIKDAKEEDVEEDENFKKHTSEQERIFMFLNKASKGDLKAIKSYLKTDEDLLHNSNYDGLLRSSNYDGRTALHLAVAEGHYDLVEFIIGKIEDRQINKPDRWEITPLHEALKNGDGDMIELFKNNMKEFELSLSNCHFHSP